MHAITIIPGEDFARGKYNHGCFLQLIPESSIRVLYLSNSFNPSIVSSVTLKWNGSHENISGYKIYYGTKSGVYNEAQYTPIVIENVQEYTVEGLEEGRVYYFTVTAIGGEGGNIESGFSEEVYVRPIQ